MIVITSPTGNIGRQVLDAVLQTNIAVRVIARDPRHLPDQVRDRVEVVAGSHGDADVVDAAFAGADAVFWLVPPAPQATDVHAAYVGFSQAAAQAFGTHGVKRVVGISALGRGTPLAAHAGLVTASLAMDDLICATGVAYRALTMPSFMDNLLRQVPAIKAQGAIFGPINGATRMPFCATRDIAAVAARLLLDTGWRDQREVAVLGPEDLSFDDMAGIIGEVLGKPVRYQQIPFAAYQARFVEMGMSEAFAQAMTDMAMAKDAGLDKAVPRTPETASPTHFRAWCAEVLRPAVLA
jgi:uncharacterized protein YbjT (DUF2867 family)